MSGGVDSLRAAVLLRETGVDLIGIHMRLRDDFPAADPLERAALPRRSQEEIAADQALRLGIPLVLVDLRDAFEQQVIRPFAEAYRQGSTPNPCVRCNATIKFGRLLEEVRRCGADRLATGHYARILPPTRDSDRFRLCRAMDTAKDQSYFLHGLTQPQLASALFPLGDHTKEAVRRWAADAGWAPVHSEESQEICFIPSGSYHQFLKEREGTSRSSLPGPIVDMEGRILGEHKGICAYTIGQRRGLGIASTAPYYVVGIEPETSTIRVGRDRDLLRSELKADEVNWVSIACPGEPIPARVRIRNRHEPAPALVVPVSETEVIVRFQEPQRAVTPGQSAVFYREDLLLGGGAIRSATWSGMG